MDLLSAFFNGLIIGSTPLIFNQLGIKGELFTGLLIVIISFGVALAINAIVQASVCNTIQPASLAKNSAFQPAFSAIFLGLSYIPILSWAVEGILPAGINPELARSLSKGFYLFWGSVYSQMLGGGFIQSCVA